MANRELRKTLKKLLVDGSEVRLNTPKDTYIGKIFKVTNSEVLLKPYAVQEPFQLGAGNFRRARIEEEEALPLQIKGTVPEKMSEGYMDYLVKATNYSNYRAIRNESLTNILFKGFPLPSQEEIDIIEGRETRENQFDQTLTANNSGGRAGFNYTNRDKKLN